MGMQSSTKEMLKKEISKKLSGFPEVRRIVVFGSFLTSNDPHDIDIAVFQDSDEGYYPLALKYRKILRSIANEIPIDVIPVRPNSETGPFMQEIGSGEVLYER
jgi:uncharacterized protein